MVFYLYFDPAVIAVAEAGGEYATQHLIGVIRGFEANCLLAEFDDFFVQDSIGDRLNAFREDNARKMLKSLFATLKKRNRFVYSLTSVGEPENLRVAVALMQAKQAELDLILADTVGSIPNPYNIPVCDLLNYGTTAFEIDRCAIATGGRTFVEGSRGQVEFLDWTLRKILKHTDSIQIYDRLFGQKFSGNFEYSAKVILRWLEGIVANPDKLELQIHCGKPAGSTDEFIKNQLSSFRQGRLAKMPITIQFYDTASGAESLPHERYLITQQVAIDLGRGMDFLNPLTQKNREGKFSFVRISELDSVLKAISAIAHPPIRF